jgi:hypothetical protein
VTDPLHAACLIPFKYRHLYQINATFHDQINLLANLLPLWVDGIAEAAEETDREIKARYEQIMRFGTPQITLDELHEQGIG